MSTFEERQPDRTFYERTSSLRSWPSLRSLLDKSAADEVVVRLTFGGTNRRGRVLKIMGPVVWFQPYREYKTALLTGLPQTAVGEPVAIAIDHIVAVQESPEKE